MITDFGNFHAETFQPEADRLSPIRESHCPPIQESRRLAEIEPHHHLTRSDRPRSSPAAQQVLKGFENAQVPFRLDQRPQAAEDYLSGKQRVRGNTTPAQTCFGDLRGTPALPHQNSSIYLSPLVAVSHSRQAAPR